MALLDTKVRPSTLWTGPRIHKALAAPFCWRCPLSTAQVPCKGTSRWPDRLLISALTRGTVTEVGPGREAELIGTVERSETREVETIEDGYRTSVSNTADTVIRSSQDAFSCRFQMTEASSEGTFCHITKSSPPWK